ncbi:AbrB/MazE/SpoVT family DNA-binding domain-containing protein [bacterium]|nr:AbrB/MazE/SpoVT family DNA-binding domain-containing protein [bacterium]MBU1613918.1 AbrB/MazE/SpoVT family DNA-binding domain-containing protein [bacterium]
MSVVKVREKYQVTIPQDVRQEIPCEVGEYVRVAVEDNHIVIYPMVLEEKFSDAEIALLEKALQASNNQGKRMGAQEFRKYLEKI